MRDKMGLSQLWQVWPVAGPWHLTPLSGGTNNLVWRAETADGERYVLRMFPDLTRLPRLRYEAALLLALSDVELPFRLPLPIRTHSGGSIAFLLFFEKLMNLMRAGTYREIDLSSRIPGFLKRANQTKQL